MRVVDNSPARVLGWADVYPSGTLLPMKDSGLRIRVEKELRERFLATCREQDRPAAQVIREFMRAYINENENDSGKKAKRKQA